TAALALVTLPGSSTILTGGLESSLVLVLLVATWHRWCRTVESEVASDSDWLMLGSFCAAALLARIEALVLVPAGLLLGHRRLRSEPRRAAAFLVPPGIAAVAFLLWNRLGFGLWLPVSGLIKAEWARRASFWRRVTGFLDLPWFGQDLFDRALSIAGIPPGS